MNSEKQRYLTEELLGGTVPDCLPEDLEVIVHHIDHMLSTSSSPSVELVRKALGALNNERFFVLTCKLAKNWHLRRSFDPTVEKYHIQALLEQGYLDEAEERLIHAISSATELNNQRAKIELGEYQGQQGRIAKQRFILFDDPDSLNLAIKLYAVRYRNSGRSYFHGINVVALIAAQQRLDTGMEIEEDLQLPGLADEVLADVMKRMSSGDRNQWLLATASEAYLSLNHSDEAELWLHRFLQHPQTHPFHIESYSRQLRELWLGNALRNETCADRLCWVIDRHVMRTQKRWSISPEMLKTAQSEPQSLEKNFSGERTFTVDMIKRMLHKCSGIGCITDKIGRRLGTGFLISADTFGLGTSDEKLFVTNSHVIGDRIRGAISPADAWVTFELESAANEQPILHKVIPEVLFSSPPGIPGITAADKLDVTVVKLETWPQGGQVLRTNDSLPTPSRKTKIFIVGHPSGDALQLSLHDTELLDVCDENRLLHYRTPTEPGSSGSPVFNMNWEVVALHHAGSSAMPRLRGPGEYEANEGISISAIRHAITPRINGR